MPEKRISTANVPPLRAFHGVAVGQVWEDRDPRDAGRQIRVETVGNGDNPFVTAVTVANPGKPWLVGRGRTELRAQGLRRRWRLIQESPS